MAFYQSNYSSFTLLPGHGIELTYLWGTVKMAGFNFTAEEEKLSHDMMQYWGNFVKYANPNGLLDSKEEVIRLQG